MPKRMTYDGMLDAHEKLIGDHGLGDAQNVVSLATELSVKAKITFPEALDVVSQIGQLIVERERAGGRVWK